MLCFPASVKIKPALVNADSAWWAKI